MIFLQSGSINKSRKQMPEHQNMENHSRRKIMRNMITNLLLTVALIFSLSSCASLNTNQKQGTAIGAGVGAGLGAALGQAIGRDHQSTLWGAGIGAALGGLTGNQLGQYMDHQEQELRNAIAASEASSIRRTKDVLVATFKGETYFAHNSTVLKPGGYQEISRMASVLNRYPETRIQVAGHTDQKGSESYNQQLSWKRAEAVKNALVQQGVNPQRISTIGYGESQPISSSYAQNRRVEVTIIPM
jgi:outer membrane protein OmpA-like peptidoglycan-associated protein